jgi:TRAP transporter TAXI family solute receptor
MRRASLLVVSMALAGGLFDLDGHAATAEVVRINGSVGYSQFLRVSQWLARNLVQDKDPPQVWFDYHITAKMFRDSLLQLASGQAEITLINSRGVAAMAVRGTGLFDTPLPNLRAIAALPHYDWAFFAVDASLGVRSFAELRQKKIPLTLTTGFLDGDNAVGFMAIEVLRRHGIDPADIRRWGGEIRGGSFGENRADMLSGKANAVFQEAARGKEWEELAKERPLAFLPLEPAVAKALSNELGFGALEVPANYYPGQHEPFLAVDFSDWPICVREDMDDRLAYRLAQIVVERREELDREYRSEPARYSSINYPLTPQKLRVTDPLPLHPGAARYYRENGVK